MKAVWPCSRPLVLLNTIFFLYKTGESSLDVSVRQYIVDIVCVSKNKLNIEICQNHNYSEATENEIQAGAGMYLTFYRIIVNVPSILLGLCFGSWSDRNGRKVPMLLPSLGSALAVILYCVSVTAPVFNMGFVMLGAAVQGLFGKSSAIMIAVNSYASDMTTDESRSAHLGILIGMNFLGLFFGAFLSSTILYFLDVAIIMYLSFTLHAISVLLILFFLPESISLSAERSGYSFITGENSNEQNEDVQPVEKPNVCKRMWSQVSESFHVLTKAKNNRTRAMIWILIVMALLNQTCKVGEYDITLLFVKRRPFVWDEAAYSLLVAIDYGIMSISTFILVPALSHICKMSDVTIIALGVTCKIIRLVWSAFMNENWMVFVAIAIGALAGMISSCIRSLLSKIVRSDDSGKMFSLVASTETVSKLIGTVVFINIYSATVSFWPGFAFLLEAVVYIFILVLIGLLWFILRKTSSDNVNDDECIELKESMRNTSCSDEKSNRAVAGRTDANETKTPDE